MSRTRAELEFENTILDKRTSFENFLCKAEEMATATEVTAIASGRGNAQKFQRYLKQLEEYSNDSGGPELSEQQQTHCQLQTSDQLAEHPVLLKALSSLCVDIYTQQFRDCEASRIDALGVYFRLVLSVMHSFHNFTDAGVKLCLALSRIDLLFTDFVAPVLTNWVEKHSDADCQACRKLVASALGVTYNLFHKGEAVVTRNLMRRRMKEPVWPYLRSPIRNIQVQATLLIAFALDEGSSNEYECAPEVIKFHVTGLLKSLKSPDRLYSIDGIAYQSIELCTSIDRLALNDRNKELLVKFELLPVLHTMCSTGQEAEVAAALNILLTLSFREENKQIMREQFNEVLRELFGSSEPLRSTGGLWRNCRAMQGLNQFMQLDNCSSVDTPDAGFPELQHVAIDPNFSSWEFFLDENGKNQVIGSGGFGIVYKVITDRYQSVAMKMIQLGNEKGDNLERAIAQEMNGIDILKNIRHPNIVLYFKCERTSEGRFCIFTELISGYSLFDLMIRQKKPFDESAVRNFSLQICSALNFLHCCQSRPILHRDIKCSNIMLTFEGIIKLIDFGLAKEIVATTTTGAYKYSTDHASGTWYFMAIELFSFEGKAQYTTKSDVWAFGCTVFEMREGQPPNGELKEQQIPMALHKRDMPQLSPGVSAQLCDFYGRCVVKEPKQRADITELLNHPFLAH